ncbi:toprim domain-containing protein [Chryseobacterium sp. M5A1_1a]
MDYLIDWDRIKKEVDIEQYFLFKMGNLYSFDKYKKAYVLNEKNGDIIRFFYHEKSGIKMYYSIAFQDSGDIIQFIKKRILHNINADASDVNTELTTYLGMDHYGTPNNKEIARPQRRNDVSIGDSYKVYGDIIQKIDQHHQYLTEFRKLSLNTIESEIFNGVLFTYHSQSTESLAFYLKDIDGEIVGLNRIQTAENELFNKKWFDKNSRNGIGFTFSNTLHNTETLSIFESLFDAMSFQELNQCKSVQYCVTNGELSFRKAQLIIEYFRKNKFKNIVLGNDKDVAGSYFNLNVIGSFIESVTNIQKSKNNICIGISGSFDGPIKILSQFFKETETKFELEEHAEYPQTYFTETLSQNKTEYFFMISNTLDSIQFFVGLLIQVWSLEEVITIHQPINKDFNEDLIQIKNAAHG